MWHALWARATSYNGDRTNLEDLQRQLADRFATLLMAVCALLIWLNLRHETFPMAAYGLLAMLIGVGWAARKLVNIPLATGRHVLVWSAHAGLLVALTLFADTWLPFLGLPLVAISALLISGGEVAGALLVVAAAASLNQAGVRSYPLAGLSGALLMSVALAWLTRRTLYTALQWAWNMQQQADRLLAEARENRAALSETLKSLNASFYILDRKQRELVEARREAEESQRMKERFAANISHELRTPLNLILGFSEVMYMSPEVYHLEQWPPALRRDVYHIFRSSRHLLEMIDDILDLSRFEMSGFTLNKEPTALAPLLLGTLEVAEDLFRGRPVCLQAEIAHDLPPIWLDRTRVRQVLLNLFNNAQRFTETGTVCLSARRTGDHVEISVSDTGPGIPEDQLPYIFDEFYQVDSSIRRSYGGAGLGLAISKHFVQAHGGHIWVESEVGVGSTFFFTLPAQSPVLPGVRRDASYMATVGVEVPRPSILVVDPDPRVAAMVRRHVEGYEIVQVDEPRRVYDDIRLHHPRAVVWNVPPGGQHRSDGIWDVPVPLIECSLPSQAWIANDLAVAACLIKPITAQQLLREIDCIGDVRDIVIVDDDRGFGQLVERILSTTRRTLKVRRAYDGAEGLTVMDEQPPDLVLLDLAMPERDGYWLLEQMRSRPELAGIPTILLTASSFEEDALTQHGNRIVIDRGGGLHTAEVLRCIREIVAVVEPRYDALAPPPSRLAPTHD